MYPHFPNYIRDTRYNSSKKSTIGLKKLIDQLDPNILQFRCCGGKDITMPYVELAYRVGDYKNG